jgi:hypothetical protein
MEEGEPDAVPLRKRADSTGTSSTDATLPLPLSAGGKPPPRWTHAALAQAARATVLFAVITLEYTTYSFLFPFFPLIVQTKGVPAAASGALFAAYALSLVLAAALTGLVLLRRYRPKTLLVVFLLVNGVATCTMTVVPSLQPPAFTIAAFVLRAVQGGAAGVVETAVVPILFRMYPAHLGRVNGAPAPLPAPTDTHSLVHACTHSVVHRERERQRWSQTHAYVSAVHACG